MAEGRKQRHESAAAVVAARANARTSPRRLHTAMVNDSASRRQMHAAVVRNRMARRHGGKTDVNRRNNYKERNRKRLAHARHARQRR